ncbi:retron Ec78 anti-phage system effector HNH endonuclease PtuB [Azohydromonas lata]|uniref:retron Ec78 anti-phage system effector HNH endonuclease PtuB n=1 Tax=Azohydromonas lata TaxID=45677 RepID=UPI0009FFB6E6|nr:retron Ec78 anti-phage system effector HNH endonuclease PtuB [Azohydromonas lata]
MHKLNRGTAPRCLNNYKHGRDNWDAVSSSDKQEIWVELDAMQGARCAYCECAIAPKKRHIEHFVQRDRNPSLTFAWANLFGSCLRKGTCGDYKDKLPLYDPADLVKPDIEDPDNFFVFTVEGNIGIRRGISPRDQHRAEETLRILNLDAKHGPLRSMRREAARDYVETAECLAELASQLSQEELQALVQEEIEKTAGQPFATVIRHVLSRNF